MNNGKFHDARKVLIFNRRKILTMIAASINEAAKFSDNLKPGNISNACNGRLISLGMYYFRYINPEIEIELSDIGTLTLTEYDKLCEVDRPVYATMKMNRKNWKYNKTKNKNNENQNL